MSHIPCRWVISYMNKSCHICMSHVIKNDAWRAALFRHMSHVTHEWVISCRMNGSCLICMSHVPYAWVMFHMHEPCRICMSHVIYECVMSRMNEWRPIPDTLFFFLIWVMSHMNESYLIVWMTHVPYAWVTYHTNEPCRTWMSSERYWIPQLV